MIFAGIHIDFVLAERYTDSEFSISTIETVFHLGMIMSVVQQESGSQESESQISEPRSVWSARLDKWGMSASLFCAIHCALLPIVAGVLPLLGLTFLGNHAIEDTVIVFAFIVASLSLLPSYFRTHRKALALVLFVAGFSLLIIGHAITQEWLEAPLAVAGGLGVAIAHWVNHRECQKCPRCQEGECGHAH